MDGSEHVLIRTSVYKTFSMENDLYNVKLYFCSLCCHTLIIRKIGRIFLEDFIFVHMLINLVVQQLCTRGKKSNNIDSMIARIYEIF